MINTEENKQQWIEKVKQIMKIGGKSDVTFDNYKSHIKRFLNYYNNKTDFNNILEDEILNYINEKYLKLNRLSDTINVAICSIKFLYSVCFKIELNSKMLPTIKRIQTIPAIIPKSDFLKILNETDNLKHKCWLLLGFCSGLRGEEITTLKIENIYADEHKIKVLGKGNKERYTILPDVTIKFLRLYCKYNHITNKTGYLFKGYKGGEHISRGATTELFTEIKEKYNLPQNMSFHSLRHSFATYYLMNGGDLISLQTMLGHNSINTTRIYIHVSNDYNHLKGIKYCE